MAPRFADYVEQATRADGSLDLERLEELVNAASTAADDLARRDKAALRTVQRKLKQQATHFAATLDYMAHGLSLYDRHAKLVACNRLFLEIYRLPPECARPGTTFRKILEERANANTHTGGHVGQYVEERVALAKRRVPATGVVRLNTGQVISVTHQPLADGGWVSTHRDITEMHNMQAELTHLAYHDALTGLANRNLVTQELRQAFSARRDGESFALLGLDLDGFKAVNDTLGHSAGDKLLKLVANRLRAVAGPGDLVGRMGGDEFAVLHSGASPAERAEALADAITETMRVPFEIDDQVASIGVSVGIALAPENGTSPDLLHKSADLALYAAKREQRGSYRFFEPGMDRAAVERAQMERALQDALENGEFELAYQPILNLKRQTFSGFEALLRWRHPTEGMISPATFVPIAEELGLIVPIGEWVLREALAEAARWPQGLSIAVNVSPVQFRRGNLVALVMNALATTGIPSARVEIEITESVLLGNSAANIETLKQLHELGVRVALDDFGTGYSALGYLLRFPFDKIKIDGSFVRALDDAEAAQAIVRAVSDIGSRIGVVTTAEGVETPEQLRNVHALGYTEAQGYLISRPLDRNAVRNLLNAAFDTMPEAPAFRAAG